MRSPVLFIFKQAMGSKRFSALGKRIARFYLRVKRNDLANVQYQRLGIAPDLRVQSFKNFKYQEAADYFKTAPSSLHPLKENNP
jgi:hypothetical protein